VACNDEWEEQIAAAGDDGQVAMMSPAWSSEQPAGDILAETSSFQGPRGAAGSRSLNERIRRLKNQHATEAPAHVKDAAMKAALTFLSTRPEKTNAKASIPTEPMAAPAASSAAAFFPLPSPSNPAFLFRRISCFSTKVALAQKSAGRARKRPPTMAPN
jgi:hypothetical protein